MDSRDGYLLLLVVSLNVVLPFDQHGVDPQIVVDHTGVSNGVLGWVRPSVGYVV